MVHDRGSFGIADRVHIMVDISDDTQIVQRRAEVTGAVRRRQWSDEEKVAKIALLERLYKLRRERRRFVASFITTYSVNLPFYESVVLRHLEAAGSRLNVVLVDAQELAKCFVAESTRPQRAGLDYVLLPVRTGGAFHPAPRLSTMRSQFCPQIAS